MKSLNFFNETTKSDSLEVVKGTIGSKKVVIIKPAPRSVINNIIENNELLDSENFKKLADELGIEKDLTNFWYLKLTEYAKETAKIEKFVKNTYKEFIYDPNKEMRAYDKSDAKKQEKITDPKIKETEQLQEFIEEGKKLPKLADEELLFNTSSSIFDYFLELEQSKRYSRTHQLEKLLFICFDILKFNNNNKITLINNNKILKNNKIKYKERFENILKETFKCLFEDDFSKNKNNITEFDEIKSKICDFIIMQYAFCKAGFLPLLVKKFKDKDKVIELFSGWVQKNHEILNNEKSDTYKVFQDLFDNNLPIQLEKAKAVTPSEINELIKNNIDKLKQNKESPHIINFGNLEINTATNEIKKKKKGQSPELIDLDPTLKEKLILQFSIRFKIKKTISEKPAKKETPIAPEKIDLSETVKQNINNENFKILEFKSDEFIKVEINNNSFTITNENIVKPKNSSQKEFKLENIYKKILNISAKNLANFLKHQIQKKQYNIIGFDEKKIVFYFKKRDLKIIFSREKNCLKTSYGEVTDSELNELLEPIISKKKGKLKEEKLKETGKNLQQNISSNNFIITKFDEDQIFIKINKQECAIQKNNLIRMGKDNVFVENIYELLRDKYLENFANFLKNANNYQFTNLGENKFSLKLKNSDKTIGEYNEIAFQIDGQKIEILKPFKFANSEKLSVFLEIIHKNLARL